MRKFSDSPQYLTQWFRWRCTTGRRAPRSTPPRGWHPPSRDSSRPWEDSSQLSAACRVLSVGSAFRSFLNYLLILYFSNEILYESWRFWPRRGWWKQNIVEDIFREKWISAFSGGLMTPGWKSGTQSGVASKDLDLTKIGTARNKIMDMKLVQVGILKNLFILKIFFILNIDI